jgi:NADH:ubiquinone oxidoreductase subunit 3 (subunit A)
MRGVGLIALIIGAGILAIIFFLCTMLFSFFFARKGRHIMFRDFYECGFRAIPDNKINLDVQFSVLTLIFLIYDMEIIVLVPLLVNISSLPSFIIIFVIIILVILGLSYWYE